MTSISFSTSLQFWLLSLLCVFMYIFLKHILNPSSLPILTSTMLHAVCSPIACYFDDPMASDWLPWCPYLSCILHTAAREVFKQPACVVPLPHYLSWFPIALWINIQLCDLQGIPWPQQLFSVPRMLHTPDIMLLHVLFVGETLNLSLRAWLLQRGCPDSSDWFRNADYSISFFTMLFFYRTYDNQKEATIWLFSCSIVFAFPCWTRSSPKPGLLSLLFTTLFRGISLAHICLLKVQKNKSC